MRIPGIHRAAHIIACTKCNEIYTLTAFVPPSRWPDVTCEGCHGPLVDHFVMFDASERIRHDSVPNELDLKLLDGMHIKWDAEPEVQK